METYFIGDYYVSDGTKPIETKLKMPIEWIPLEETEDGNLLLLSKNVLDWELYAFDGDKIIYWKESHLFDYLSKLYGSIFCEEEKEAIIENEYGKIFVLSQEEIKRYLPTNEKRRAVAFFIYKDKDEIKTDIEHSFYWLRGDNCSSDKIPYVESLGNIDHHYSDADETGIRPAIWIDKKKAHLISAKKGYNKWHHFWQPEEF